MVGPRPIPPHSGGQRQGGAPPIPRAPPLPKGDSALTARVRLTLLVLLLASVPAARASGALAQIDHPPAPSHATLVAREQARVRISGSATVRMPSKPPQLDVSVSGSGHVVTD